MDLGLGKDKQEEQGEEQGKEIQKVGKSVLNGMHSAGSHFSEDAKDGMDWLGQKLGIDYDRPNENGKTMRQIREGEKQDLAEEDRRLEEESPYKGIFNEVKKDFYSGLNIAGLAMAVRDLPALAKAGFGAIKDFNMALKSLGIDAKFLDQGLELVEVNSKKVTGKLSKEAEELREAIMNLFGKGAGKADNVITEADRIKQFNLNNCRGQMKDDLSKLREILKNDKDAKGMGKICSTVDLGDLNLKGEAGSGIWKYNPTIKDYTGVDPREFCKTTEDYTKYYRSLLSDEHLESLPDSFWVGKNKEFVKEDMSKLRADIERVKSEAADEGEFNQYGEPSFESDWNVDNCAEIWSSRDAILKGARYDDLVYRTEHLGGGFAEPCENCKITFKGTYNIDN
jgi:hypothetical protein